MVGDPRMHRCGAEEEREKRQAGHRGALCSLSPLGSWPCPWQRVVMGWEPWGAEPSLGTALRRMSDLKGARDVHLSKEVDYMLD